ncbi:Fc.00g090680.m01.CDS01 [Cosmosporella sp. VM-42]
MENPANSPNNMSHLECLPPEILQHILQWLNPADLVTVPRDTPDKRDLDWEKEIHDLLKLQSICHRRDAADKKKELGFVYETVTRLLQNASPNGEPLNYSNTHSASHNANLLKELFEEDSNIEAFLQRSFLFERVRNEVHHPIRVDEVPRESHQQSAKLHCLYGKPILNVGRLRSSRSYPFACSKVYDMRQYTRQTKWGPFMNDDSDRVDWEKVEAIIVVLGHNIRKLRLTSKVFSEVWDSPFSGSWSGSYMPYPRLPLKRKLYSLDEKDPYGVAGTWYQIVCFLDYNDFFSYNFPIGDFINANTPRPALDVGEATRLVMMKVRVTSIEPPGPDDGQELPVVHFKGVSRSLDDLVDDNANSGLRGTVRLTKEGEVRWTTFSVFNGQERWRSEGVQIGGVRSARGVIGNWFDSDYDVHGPAGPTAFWKASDATEAMLPNEFFMPHGPLLDLDLDSSDFDEDEQMEDEVVQAEVADELLGLLVEADMNVEDVLAHYVENHPETG